MFSPNVSLVLESELENLSQYGTENCTCVAMCKCYEMSSFTPLDFGLRCVLLDFGLCCVL